MEKNKVINLEFASSLTEVHEINSSFDSAILRIAYTGQNRNKSYISKGAFEKCIESMYNCPIVCNYDRDSDTLGGHDIELVVEKDGSMRIVNATDPVGVIPTGANWYWDTVEEEDGSQHEYLFANVLLWKRQEAYRKIKKDGITSHSMEITVFDGELLDDGYFHIYDFEFTAFCLIGVEPCYESSALIFSNQGIKQQIAEMMQDLKDSISSVVTPSGDDNIHPQKYSMEGGEEKLEERMKLAAKYGIDLYSLDFSVEDFTIEELEEKFAALSKASEEAHNDEPEQPQDFALTQGIVDEIRRNLSEETYETVWGVETRYWYIDCDLDSNEVYAYDISDWLIYGFTYSLNGDNVEIDFESKKRKKFAIVDFDEGEQVSPIGAVFENASKAVSDAIAEKNEIEEKYNSVSDALTNAETELNDLRSYKIQNEENILSAKREAIFEKFEDLNGIEDFTLLKENCSEMALDVLEEKCYAIRGRYNVPSAKSFSLESGKAPKLPIQPTDTPEDDEPYGGVVKKYLK